METYTLNIGMGNNPYDYTDLQKHLVAFNAAKTGMTFSLGRMAMGQYNGEDEETFVTRVTTTWRLSTVIEYIENLCQHTNQSCIAVKSANFEALVYDKDFAGKKQLFNNEYFNL